jgi:CBS domain-containing protein
MATRWCQPRDWWVRRFRQWVDAPEPEALVEALNFFDFRVVHGDLALNALDDVLASAGGEQRFLAHLARASLGMTPPLGAFRTIRQDEGGVDLKKGGIMPIVSLARLYALEARSRARTTLARLAAAADAGTLSREGATTLDESFRFLVGLRLREQLRALSSRRAPSHHVQLEHLTPLERQHLKDVFRAVREIQSATASRYAIDRLA